MALCPSCKSISISALVCELADVPPWWAQLNSKSKPRGMIHHHDARQLAISAASGCPLCAMMEDALLQNVDNQLASPHCLHKVKSGVIDEWNSHLIESPIYLRPNYDPLKLAFPEDEVANAPYVRGFKVFVPVDHGILTGQIRLFAPKDTSPAAVVGRSALPSSDSPEAYELIGRWLKTCMNNHEVCRETFSGAVVDESSPPILPTRVIHVGRAEEGLSPRLLETKGLTGFYVALSHAWGPHKPPLMTTQSTLERNKAGIPWEDIPKVYQDTITATHRLGFEYIWIDSLCITQDCKDDWLRESKQMGAVYENARLTIAASHASDSSQPCFFNRPQMPASVEIPYISSTGERGASIFAAPMPIDYVPISPEDGPLASRAWATQEWLLSRRIIFYTAGCLVWSCKIISQRETGGSFHSTARNAKWKAIIEKYSARALTQPGDRLVALEGLRIEMGKRRENDTYCFGLWKYSMPDQLLWFCLEPAERSKSPIGSPTWSWASTMHGVRFLDIKKAKNACSGFHFDEANKILIIEAYIRKATITSSNIVQPDDTAHPPFTSLIVRDIVGDQTRSHMMCYIHDNNGAVAGWAVLDEGGSVKNTTIMCLRLMTSKVINMNANGRKQKCIHEWVLLLQRVDGLAEVYERVGAGMTTLRAEPSSDNLPPTCIYVQ